MMTNNRRNYEMSTSGSVENELKVGEIVKIEVRSGHYAGELVELNGPRALVKVLAVLKHPEQGDLHQPYDPDVAMFHERRALSFTEKRQCCLET